MSTRAASDPEPLPDAGRMAALDGLRGLAIALVLWNHLVIPLLTPGWLTALTADSWAGVDLFFALSGFLIGGGLIDRRDSPRLLRVFYLRRGARILPLYYVALAAVFAALLAGLPGAYHRVPLWVHPLFLTNLAFALDGRWDWGPLSVFWSLAVEEQFYLAAPWVVRALRPDRVGWLAAGLIAASECLRVATVVVAPGPHLFIHVLTPFHLDSLGFGILCAWMVRTAQADRAIAFLVKAWPPLAGAGLLILGLLTHLHGGEGSPPTSLLGYLVIGAGSGLLVLVAVRGGSGIARRILENPVLVHLGRRSYFVYLFHYAIWYGFAALFAGPPGPRPLEAAGMVVATLAFTGIAAEVSWRWLEGPLLAWGHRQKY